MKTKLPRFILVSTIISVLAVAGFNYFVDPFGIFKTNFIHDFSINERYRKMDYLIHHPQNYNSFLLGSSVVGLYDPSTATRLSNNGSTYYNLSYLGGTPKESYQSILALQASGIKIKEAIIGIDLFAFKNVDHPYGPADHPHPLITGESPARFLSSYLFASSFYQGFTKITHSMQPIPDIRFNPDTDGHYELVRYDMDIKVDHAAFIDKHLIHATTPKGIPVWIPQRFAELKELVDLLNKSGVHARYFIHPFSHVLTAAQPPETMISFRKLVNEIVPEVYDFSGYEQITNNDCLFYDIKHYRPVVADKLIEAILTDDRSPEHLKFDEIDTQCLTSQSNKVAKND